MRRLLLATIFLTGAASTAMAIDFSQPIKTFDGKDFTDQTGAFLPLVLGTVVENSLLQTASTDTVDDKNKRFWLAYKIHMTPKDPTMTAEDITTIKKAVGTYQPTAIMGQAFRLIDPASVPKN